MNDADILGQIRGLVDREHTLRGGIESGEIGQAEEHAELQTVEQQLDQCWDLLRQRQARRAAGQDPEAAQVRPAWQVENYRQ
jgi:hypothetical protein